MEVEIKKKKINLIFPEPNMIGERIDVKDCLKATSRYEIDQLIIDDSYIFKKQAHKGYLWYYPEHTVNYDNTVTNHHPREMPNKADHVIDLLFLPHVFKDKGIAVITHSELFFLRIQRRIRETAKGDASDSKFLRAKDVNLLCVDKELGVVPIKLDKRGDFLTEWPNGGFFLERMDEI